MASQLRCERAGGVLSTNNATPGAIVGGKYAPSLLAWLDATVDEHLQAAYHVSPSPVSVPL